MNVEPGNESESESVGKLPPPERRKGYVRGRPVFSGGPIIRGIEIANAIIGILAVVALIIALLSETDAVQAENHSRFRAAEDTCFLLRGLVFTAAPAGKLARAQAYINGTPLKDCYLYAYDLTHHP